MKFKRYYKLQDFANENLDLLLEKEWLNNLIVGNIDSGIEEGMEDWEKYLLARIEDDRGNPQLILLLRRPWNLVVYSPMNNKSDELYKYAAVECSKIYDDIPGINADVEVAEKFASFYCDLVNKIPKVRMPMRILLLEKINEVALRDDVVCRKATWDDKETLKKFIFEFNEEALHTTLTDEELESNIKKRLANGSEYFVLEKDGKIVAQTTSSRRLKKGKCVSGVYTAKEARGQGYAFNLVYRVSKEYLDNGAEYCVLFTDDTNPISNHVYEKIGYKRMLDIEEIDFV